MASATTPAARREDGAPSNWDRYLDLLARRGVPEKFRRWYVRRVEDLLKAVRPDSLARLSAQQVSSYLQQVLSRKGPADWQFGQVVDAFSRINSAIHLLFEIPCFSIMLSIFLSVSSSM